MDRVAPEERRAVCDAYTLTVWPDEGKVRARCWGCDAEIAKGQITKADGQMHGVQAVLSLVSGWMVEHAVMDGMKRVEAEKAFGSGVKWNAVGLWALIVMTGGVSDDRPPLLGRRSGFWLSPEPGGKAFEWPTP